MAEDEEEGLAEEEGAVTKGTALPPINQDRQENVPSALTGICPACVQFNPSKIGFGNKRKTV